MGDINEAFRLKLKNVIEQMKDNCAQFLKNAQVRGELAKTLELNEATDFIMSFWQGAVLQAKVMRSTVPFMTFDKLVFNSILKDGKA